jgi:class I fructose-bisphosphate aldolase
MKVSRTVQKILSYYESDNPGVKGNLSRMLMQGRLGGTGKMIILPVDQGFEHGPARSFAPNPAAYDPHYHYQLAIDAGLNAYAAPLGMIETGADAFAGQIPTILKMNSSNSLVPGSAPFNQAITASVDDALRLGCAAIGFTVYPGSSEALDMFEEISELREEAAAKGVPTVIWSYPRGEDLSKAGETAIDVGAYAAQIAALLGAHVIKIKLSTDHLEQGEAKKVYEKQGVDVSTPAARVRHCMQAAFAGRRIVVFSGGAAKGADAVYDDARAIRDGGGNGSIIGRNTFQRTREDAMAMLDKLVEIYKGRA